MEDNEAGSENGYGNPGSLSALLEESSSRHDCGVSGFDLAGKSGMRLYIREII